MTKNNAKPPNISISCAVFLALGILLLPGQAQARVDPLQVIAGQWERTEILILFDVSQSMQKEAVAPFRDVGTDCGGEQTGLVDLCGDGLCSGNEGSAKNPCVSDCPAPFDYYLNPAPISMRRCDPQVAAPQASRIFTLKRVLGQLLPRFNHAAAFGLISYFQKYYHRYLRADPLGPAEVVSEYFPSGYLKAVGGWDAQQDAPAASFVYQGTPYTRLDQDTVPLSVDLDSLYAREDDLGQRKRMRFSQAGNTLNDGTYTWRYQGSYYAFARRPLPSFKPEEEVLELVYRGPQFKDQSGDVWVHNPFYFDDSSQGIATSSGAGKVYERINPDPSQAAQDATMGRILTWLNPATNGGFWALGANPTGPSLQKARVHFLDRIKGTGDYAKEEQDLAGACRARYVLLITDAANSSGVKAVDAAEVLYNDPSAPRPIQTYVVGLPGLPQAAVAELDQIADMGDNGLLDGTATAALATNETELLQAIEAALLDMLKGNYTTTAATFITGADATEVGSTALMPSTDYPSWYGHLRALDAAQSPAVEQWDAGQKLMDMDYAARRLYTGYPSSAGGKPVPLLCEDGTVNLDGACSGGTGLRAVWAQAGPLPTDENLRGTALWLLGKDRPWRLGPLVRSTPAVVGPPPYYDLKGHNVFRKLHAQREPLVYITSNEGILHAFRASDGTEAFGYVPPNLWPAIYRLWQGGGAQEPNPTRCQWILAASPRVEDVPLAAAPAGWATRLVLTMGPNQRHFVVLDVTSPSTCSGATCLLDATAPFTIAEHSAELSLPDTVAETWSVPALFLDYTLAGEPQARVAMGSGYDRGAPGTAGDAYNFFGQLAPLGEHAWATQKLGTPQVDFGMITDTAAAVDYGAAREVIATYQADLLGRIVRYEAGQPAAASTVLDAGPANPFYYSPALYHLGQHRVVLAAASQATDELSPPPGAVSTLYLRAEVDGVVDSPLGQDQMTCPAHQICSGGPGCPAQLPAGCSAPSSAARPVARPLLLYNRVPGGKPRLEAFYVLYDPPTVPCDVGDTWILRVATHGAEQEVVSSLRLPQTRGTGLSLAGDGKDVVLATVGFGEETAKMQGLLYSVIGDQGDEVVPYVESWREVDVRR